MSNAPTRWKRPMRDRFGYTLIEVIASITIGSTLMMLAVGVVHQSMQFCKLGNGLADDDRTLARFDRQFRQDVHLASAFEIQAAQTLNLQQHQGTIVTYKIDRQQIERIVATDGQQTLREQFVLGDRTTASLQPLADPVRLSVVVSVQTANLNASNRIDRQIVAVPGLRILRLDSNAAKVNEDGAPAP